MSGAQFRLSKLASHFLPSPPSTEYQHRHNIHTLSPTFFLPRAAAVEPDVRGLPPTHSYNQLLDKIFSQLAPSVKDVSARSRYDFWLRADSVLT